MSGDRMSRKKRILRRRVIISSVLAGLLVLALIEWLRRAAGRRRLKKLKL